LGVTARTLRRRLCEEGSRYTALIDAVRLRDAVILLDNPAVEIHQIAEQLAYQDPANFTRAFRKWTGKTPSQYRQRSLASASHDSA
jgi:AraC-like DNA-binding protein